MGVSAFGEIQGRCRTDIGVCRSRSDLTWPFPPRSVSLLDIMSLPTVVARIVLHRTAIHSKDYQVVIGVALKDDRFRDGVLKLYREYVCESIILDDPDLHGHITVA